MVRSVAQRRVSNHEARELRRVVNAGACILRDALLRRAPQDEEDGSRDTYSAAEALRPCSAYIGMISRRMNSTVRSDASFGKLPNATRHSM
jgi:hypothetical protein